MAPSTLGPASNLGMYTARELHEGDVVPFPELIVPLLFREWNQPPKTHAVDGSRDGKLWDRYVWEGTVFDLPTYDNTQTTSSRAAFVPGVGCTVNSMLALSNIHSTRGRSYDTEEIPSSLSSTTAKDHFVRQLAASAQSPYHGAATTVSRSTLPAGSELLARYGEYWIPHIPNVQVTLQPALDQAETFLQNDYVPFVFRGTTRTRSPHNNNDDHDDNDKNSPPPQSQLSPELQEALWNFTVSFPIRSPAMSNLPRLDLHTWKDVVERYQYLQTRNTTRTTKASNQPSLVSSDKANGSTHENKKHKHNNKNDIDMDAFLSSLQDDDGVVTSFLRQQQLRPLSWLQENGYCQDHLRPGPSLMDHAGQGAFATRFLPQDTIVAFAPLVHVGLHASSLFAIAHQDGSSFYDLIVNYSFGHVNSTVLLTPYGAMVNYINHNSHSPNVKVQWPSSTDHNKLLAHHPEWLQQSPQFLRDTVQSIGLALEYVALRDIQPGEEVVMDYGPEWEQAWMYHVQQAHEQQQAQAQQSPPPPRPFHSTAVHVMAQEPVPFEYFRTVYELANHPYPSTMATLCVPSFTRLPQQESQRQQQAHRPVYTWIDPPRPHGHLKKNNKKNEKDDKPGRRPNEFWSPHRMFCIVTDRQEVWVDVEEDVDDANSTTTTTTTTPPQKQQQQRLSYRYTVDLKWEPSRTLRATASLPPTVEWVRIRNVPPHGVGLYDLALTQAWQQPTAFRHSMGLPNDIMPTAWINQ